MVYGISLRAQSWQQLNERAYRGRSAVCGFLTYEIRLPARRIESCPARFNRRDRFVIGSDVAGGESIFSRALRR